MNLDLSLYVLTDEHLSKGRTHLEVVKAAVGGGATAIQFRDKVMSSREYYETGVELRAFCRQAGVTFIVNDRIDLALALDADGVHLGPNDLPTLQARKLAPPPFLIGVSVDNVSEALLGVSQGADYLGAGPVFPTRTKLDTGPVMGVEGLKAIVDAVRVPVAGIGSINQSNIASVIATGAAGAAVISAVVSAPDIQLAAAQMLKAIREVRLSKS